MTKVIKVVYEAVKSRLTNVSEDDFMASFKDWEILPIIKDEQIIGAVLIKNAEMHIAIHPKLQNKVYLRGIIKKGLENTIKKHGKVTTKVVKTHIIGHKLAKLAGFTQVNETNGVVEYECVEVRL